MHCQIKLFFSGEGRVTSCTEMVNITLPEQLPITNNHQVRHPTGSLNYNSRNPWQAISKILDHHILSYEQLSKFGMSIVVDILCGLFLSDSSQRIGSHQIQASSQTSIQEYGRGRTICDCVWCAPIWQQEIWQSMLKRPSSYSPAFMACLNVWTNIKTL